MFIVEPYQTSTTWTAFAQESLLKGLRSQYFRSKGGRFGRLAQSGDLAPAVFKPLTLCKVVVGLWGCVVVVASCLASFSPTFFGVRVRKCGQTPHALLRSRRLRQNPGF